MISMMIKAVDWKAVKFNRNMEAHVLYIQRRIPQTQQHDKYVGSGVDI